jgi:hypothetical protein
MGRVGGLGTVRSRLSTNRFSRNLLSTSRLSTNRLPATWEEALGRGDQPVGPVPHEVEPLEGLLEPVIQPVSRVPLPLLRRRSARASVVDAGRVRR